MRLIKAKPAAEFLDVRLTRLYQLARLGIVPSVRLSERSIRFNEDALKEFVERGGVSQGNGSGDASTDREAA